MAADHKKAADITISWSQQLVTLASAVLALTGTFAGLTLTQQHPHLQGKALLITCWILLFVSILAGVSYLSVLASSFDKDADAVRIFEGPLQVMGIIQLFTFAVGTLCLLLALMQNV